MAIAKWQKAKLEEVLNKLNKGPASFGDKGNERAAAAYRVWVTTWVVPQIEDVLQDSDLNPRYRKV